MTEMTPPTTPTQRPRSSAGRACTIIAFVLAVVAIFFIPLLFGLAAVILGVVAAAALGDKPLGWYAAGAGVVGAVLGIVLALVLLK